MGGEGKGGRRMGDRGLFLVVFRVCLKAKHLALMKTGQE